MIHPLLSPAAAAPLPFLRSRRPAADVEHSLALDVMSPPQQAFEFEQAVRRGQIHNRLSVLQSNAVPQVHAFAAHFDLRPDKCDAAPASNMHPKPVLYSTLQIPISPLDTRSRPASPCAPPLAGSAPLPATTPRPIFRWQTHVDGDGRTFFYDPDANISSWDHPLDGCVRAPPRVN